MAIDNYIEYNPNPQKLEVCDCVVRALCKATDRDWYSVYDELCAFGRDLGRMPNETETAEEFLFHNGFNRCTIKRPLKGQKSMTVDYFCQLHSTGVFVLNCAHHLVCVTEGKFYDLYPSTYRCKVYSYWEKV